MYYIIGKRRYPVENNTQLLKGVLEFCVLKFISREPTYGYEIVMHLKQVGFSDLSESTLYPLLLRLEQQGKVTVERRPSPKGPSRKYYVVTEEGQEVAAPLEGKFFLTKNAQETPLKVGDKVKEGDLLCYIEAMKTYNAIRADFSGTVTAICVNPGDSVSEDDVLMKIG